MNSNMIISSNLKILNQNSKWFQWIFPQRDEEAAGALHLLRRQVLLQPQLEAGQGSRAERQPQQVRLCLMHLVTSVTWFHNDHLYLWPLITYHLPWREQYWCRGVKWHSRYSRLMYTLIFYLYIYFEDINAIPTLPTVIVLDEFKK